MMIAAPAIVPQIILALGQGNHDELFVSSDVASNWRIGSSGINWNAGSGDPAPDTDITTGSLDQLQLSASSPGNNVISAQGGAGTGGKAVIGERVLRLPLP